MLSKKIPSYHTSLFDCHALMVTHATCRVRFDLDLYGSHMLSYRQPTQPLWSFSGLCCGLRECLDRLRFKAVCRSTSTKKRRKDIEIRQVG